MSDQDSEGCGFAVVLTIACAFICWFMCWSVWSYNHPTPKEAADRQQVEQRAQEDRDLAEWNRAQQLREMRADKSRAEEPK